MKRQYSHQRGDFECQAEELGNGEPSKAFEEGRDAIGEHERKMDRGPLTGSHTPLPGVHALHQWELSEPVRKGILSPP